MQALLYANLTSRKLSDSLGGPDFDWPELIEGDTVQIGLRFAQTLGEQDLEIERNVRLVRASLGRLDTRPGSGQWAIQIGTDPPEVGVNTTTLLAHNAGAEAVQAASPAMFTPPAYSLSRVPAVSVLPRRRAGLMCVIV